MGNNTFKDIRADSPFVEDLDSLFNKNSFERVCAVGRGGFGRVWKVQSKKFSNKAYALKEMSKARILARKSLQSIKRERQILAAL
jgi:serine/threonine protein kinase